jgi:hypothetical protein
MLRPKVVFTKSAVAGSISVLISNALFENRNAWRDTERKAI